MIKAIAFDIGGVMNGVDVKSKEFHEYMANKFNISLQEWMSKINTPYNMAIEGKISKEEALNEMADNLDSDPAYVESAFVEAYDKFFVRNAELYIYAYKLKAAGYKLIIISDQWPVPNKTIIKSEDRKNFDISIISCEVGFKKPQKEIFELAISASKLNPEEIVFIDDREENTRMAQSCGMQSVQYHNNQQLFTDLLRMGVEQ